MNGGWIGCDLDGTLARYEGWVDELHIGEPIAPMVQRVKTWIARGETVKIFTARVGPAAKATRDVAAITNAIQDWCERHIGHRLEVTCVKDYAMVALFDDRCVEVEMNTGRLMGERWRDL
jgi:hypothetical protein